MKGREVLAVQERILALESEVRDLQERLSIATNAVREEADTRSLLDSRNMELELLLSKLRSKEDNADFDETRCVRIVSIQ